MKKCTYIEEAENLNHDYGFLYILQLSKTCFIHPLVNSLFIEIEYFSSCNILKQNHNLSISVY